MSFFIEHQLNIMMVLSGISISVFFFLAFMKMDSKYKKYAFLQISFFAMLLLLADRTAHFYEGDVSTVGYWMVRISNFLVYASILLVLNGFNNYLLLFARPGEAECRNKAALSFSRILVLLGLGLLIVSQFTGLYYSFSSTNTYERSPGFVICYVIPIIMILGQFAFIATNRNCFSKKIYISLLIFVTLPVVAGIMQIYVYGASLTSISIAVSSIVAYFFALSDQNSVLASVAEKEMNAALEIKRKSSDLLQQTVEALASAVDAKDTYTHGHSYRVAQYSRKIAEISGMSNKECDDIYLAGLLHDVGKIGIDDSIINKKGKLTDEEFANIKLHSTLGGQILSKIVISPYLSVGARYHHERYDGTGYPDNLKGEDIPKFARIIAVADAYDAMTSKRSYRDIIPQTYVREELIKGMGTQFDPEFAKIMLTLLDNDDEYKLKEAPVEEAFGSNLSYKFEEYKSNISVGIQITDCPITIKVKYKANKQGGQPTLILYDSADARYYLEDNYLAGEMDFIEFAAIDMDGSVYPDYVRDYKSEISTETSTQSDTATLYMVKQDDHLMIKITQGDSERSLVFALYDASRYVYLAFTGENCSLDILDVDIASEAAEEGFIPRIAPKISYIDVPAGTIPNIQVDGWVTARSEVLELGEAADINFHSMSLPSSRRIWHCPIVFFFTSDDGKVDGPNYRELAFVRFDGEVWCKSGCTDNTTTVTKTDSFENWSVWKQKNKNGVDCSLTISRKGNIIDFRIEDSGLIIENRSIIPKDVNNVYYYFTGDMCALTNIQVN